MLRSFKNLELLRYYIDINFARNFQQLAQENKEKHEELASTVFSSVFSLIFSLLITAYFEFSQNPDTGVTIKTWTDLLPFIGIMGSTYTAGYFVSYHIYLKIHRWRQSYKISRKKFRRADVSKVKEIIDDFDHVACDNILIAKEFIQHFDPTQNLQMATFYYFETIYYANVATQKIRIILVEHKSCVNNGDKTDGIDLFRIKNLCNLLFEILGFIQNNRSNISVDKNLEHLLLSQIDALKRDINNVTEKCNKLIENFQS